MLPTAWSGARRGAAGEEAGVSRYMIKASNR